ncbi:MAG TPA: VWA domain-containing protein, partial [Actinomycetes bacterium]
AGGPGVGAQPVAAPGETFTPIWLALAGTGAGAWGRRSPAETDQGQPVSDRSDHADGATLALAATLRSAATHANPSLRLRVRAEDLRWQVREGREGNLVLFLVDASGSMAARRRMTATKGAVLSLLLDAYQRRDKVGLVTFRGAGAEVLLPPTSSVELAARRLASLPTGGRTPLEAGLARARGVLDAEAVRDPRRRPLLIVVTDGRANAVGGLSGRGTPPASRGDPFDTAIAEARALADQGVAAIVIDTEDAAVKLGLAAELAQALHAPCIALETLAAQPLAGLVRAIAGTAARSGGPVGRARRGRVA